MKVELLANTPNPETLIAKCASTCYDSVPKELDKARKMIAAIIKSGHESCIEHATASTTQTVFILTEKSALCR